VADPDFKYQQSLSVQLDSAPTCPISSSIAPHTECKRQFSAEPNALHSLLIDDDRLPNSQQSSVILVDADPCGSGGPLILADTESLSSQDGSQTPPTSGQPVSNSKQSTLTQGQTPPTSDQPESNSKQYVLTQNQTVYKSVTSVLLNPALTRSTTKVCNTHVSHQSTKSPLILSGAFCICPHTQPDTVLSEQHSIQSLASLVDPTKVPSGTDLAKDNMDQEQVRVTPDLEQVNVTPDQEPIKVTLDQEQVKVTLDQEPVKVTLDQEPVKVTLDQVNSDQEQVKVTPDQEPVKVTLDIKQVKVTLDQVSSDQEQVKVILNQAQVKVTLDLEPVKVTLDQEQVKVTLNQEPVKVTLEQAQVKVTPDQEQVKVTPDQELVKVTPDQEQVKVTPDEQLIKATPDQDRNTATRTYPGNISPTISFTKYSHTLKPRTAPLLALPAYNHQKVVKKYKPTTCELKERMFPAITDHGQLTNDRDDDKQHVPSTADWQLEFSCCCCQSENILKKDAYINISSSSISNQKELLRNCDSVDENQNEISECPSSVIKTNVSLKRGTSYETFIDVFEPSWVASMNRPRADVRPGTMGPHVEEKQLELKKCRLSTFVKSNLHDLAPQQQLKNSRNVRIFSYTLILLYEFNIL